MNVPGLYFGVSIEDYHAGPGVSKSGLDLIQASPKLYYDWRLNPARPPEPERSGQLEGSLAHCAILEAGEFSKRYVVIPDDAPRKPTDAQWNAKKPSPDSVSAMEWWTKFMAEYSTKTIITREQHDTAFAQMLSVLEVPDIAAGLSVGQAEVTVCWIDEQTGELCKCRPDWVHDCGDAGVVLFDVKTCGDASPDEFRRQVARKRYHVQAAWYSDGYEQVAQRPVLGFVFIAVESSWPYAASAVMLSDRALDQGRRDYRRDLDLYAKCRKSGIWPGYSDCIETIDLPAWAYDD